VWSAPLLPGKYAFNTYAGKILMVPTTNFILKWESETIGQHKFDENLSEVSLITRDAFEPTLPLSVVVHIDYRKAPLVVQRFGDIKKLVEQTLDPMVGLFQERPEEDADRAAPGTQRHPAAGRRGDARQVHRLQPGIAGSADRHPRASDGNDQIEKVLQQLRERQVAEERVRPTKQRIAAESEKALREARPRQPADRDHPVRTLDHRARERGQGGAAHGDAGRPSRPACRPRPKATACA
jgi:uncharacterized membrane protein YqiK